MATGVCLPFLGGSGLINRSRDSLPIHIFSKHLQFLDYGKMAESAARMGFDGIDLTVRPGGHVEPERVTRQLPEAVQAIRDHGINSIMITTVVDDAADPMDIKVLETAASLDIQFYRMNWFSYPPDLTVPQAVEKFNIEIRQLAILNQKLGLIGCYQNHAGQLAGASIFELHQMLEQASQDAMGVQYDIRHATVEGGRSWETGLRLIAPRIKTLVLKDFKWALKEGKWIIENTPLGEGMVDFKHYFQLLKKYEIQAPISLHLEYPLGGAEQGEREPSLSSSHIFAAMKKDREYLTKLWQEG